MTFEPDIVEFVRDQTLATAQRKLASAVRGMREHIENVELHLGTTRQVLRGASTATESYLLAIGEWNGALEFMRQAGMMEGLDDDV